MVLNIWRDEKIWKKKTPHFSYRIICIIMINSAILAKEDIQLSALKIWETVAAFWCEGPVSGREPAGMTIPRSMY